MDLPGFEGGGAVFSLRGGGGGNVAGVPRRLLQVGGHGDPYLVHPAVKVVDFRGVEGGPVRGSPPAVRTFPLAYQSINSKMLEN